MVFLQRGVGTKNILFLRFFLRQNNTLDRDLIISANSQDWHGSSDFNVLWLSGSRSG